MIKLLQFILLCCILGSSASFGQGNWLRSIGGNSNEEVKDGILDSNGDFVMTGFFSSSLNTGVGTLNSSGNTDIFVMKTDDAGDPIWAVKAGGTGVDRANSIAEDNAGNTYITGYFQSAATFGSINVTGSGWEAYVAKIDVNGVFVWVTTFGGSFGDIGHGIDVDDNGNVICVGEYKGTATFGADVLTSQNNSYDVFITKLDNNGNFLWTRDGNADQDDRALEVTTDANGAIYAIGQFSGNITFDVTHNSTLLNAGFIVSYDAAGNEQWFNQMWGGQILLADIEWGGNNIFVTGDYQDNLLVQDFNNVQSFPAQDQYNIFTARFNEAGDLGWLSSNFSASELHATQLTLDASNDVYITGDFNCTFDEMNTIYGGSTFLSVGFEDIHYIKHNNAGAFVWARQIASKKEDHCNTITIKTVDKPILAGYHEGTLFVPAGGSFSFEAGQQQTFGGTNCGDANYGNFAQEAGAGQRDVFWTSPFDINRLPFDYFEKNPSLSCDLLTYEPCIGTEITFNDCLDTLEGCQPLTAYLNDFFIGDIHPTYTVSWSSGGSGNTQNFSSEGYYTATTTTQDMCYSWVDSIYISILPDPESPLISDSWDFNDDNLVTIPIDTCDADSVLLWAIPNGNTTDTIIWVGDVNKINDSTISAPTSGTYEVYAVNEFGCVSASNSIDVVINNFALHDTLDPHIIFSDGNIAQTDSTLTCDLAFCVSTYIVDSALTNQFGTLPNLYSVWYIDGVYFDTLFHNSDDSLLVQSPSPIDICVGTTGWHIISTELVNECGDTVFYNLVDSFYVDTIQKPYLELNGPPSACPGDTITLIANYFTDTAYWFGNQIIANYGDSVHAVFSQQNGLNISVSVDTTVEGITCVSNENYYLPPIPTPQVTVDPIDAVVCPNDSVQFTVSGGVAWQWIGPTGDSLGTNQIQYGSDIGEYFCYVTTIDGCIVASEFESTVAYSSPSLYLWEPVICVDDSALIQVLGPSNTVINWLPPLSGNEFQKYVTDAGWYYCETSFCGITKVDSVLVIISLPLSGFSMPNDTTICPYDTLVVNAPPNFAEYYWNGVPGTDTYLALDSGMYYLNVVDTNGCTDFSDTLLIEYHQLPNPPLATDTTVCPNGNAVLTAVGTGTIDWFTDNFDFIQTGNPLLINNITSGENYFATQTDAFCTSIPDTATIYLYVDNVVADFSIADDCGSLEVTVQNIGTTGLVYSWNMGDLTVLSGSPVTHTYPATGTYTITMIATDPVCGFADTTSDEVTVWGQIVTDIFNIPTCYQFSDGSLTLNVTNGEGTETFFIEDAAGNTLNVGGTNTANNLPEGWYFWEVNLGPGCTLVDSTFIDDPDALDAGMTLYHPLCFGLTGQATVDTVYNWQGNYADISFLWNPNPGNVGGLGADSSYNMLAGTYVLTINDGNGCSNSIDFTIIQPTQLVFNELGTDPAYCRQFGYQSGNGVVYAAASGGTPDYDYVWTNLGTNQTSTNTTWGGLNPGEYSIQVTDNNGCILTDIVTLDSLNPLADFDMSSLGFDVEWEGDAPLEVHFENQSAYFANPNNPNADTTFFWNFNYDTAPWVISHNINDTYDTVYTAGTYTICLTALNKNGCSDTLCQDIIVYDPVALEPPNIFTPNGDGNNDEFTFTFKSVGIETFRCVVVNRWGVTVREFNDVHDSWNGKDKSGDDCPAGVYFYVYEGAGFNGDAFSGQGTVTLVRGNQ